MDAKPRELYLLFRAYEVNMDLGLREFSSFKARLSDEKFDYVFKIKHRYTRVLSAVARVL